VRLAGHDFLDFRKTSANTTTGGADGCVNFADPDNAGLEQCLRNSNLNNVYGSFCDKLSLADFIVLAAESVMIKTATKYNPEDPFAEDSYGAKFRDRFRFGRTTNVNCSQGLGFLPDPEEGCNDLSKIFVNHIFATKRMGKNQGFQWKSIAAISGAHTLGQAKKENSGYQGVWTTSPGSWNNEYYINMLAKGWGPELGVSPGKNQWQRIDGGSADEFMLNSDLCLAYDNNKEHAECLRNGGNRKTCKNLRTNGLKGEFLNAKTTECCAWTKPGALFNNGILIGGKQNEYCNANNITTKKNPKNFLRDVCCKNEKSNTTGDCDSAGWPKGPAFNHVLRFAGNEKLWLKEFNRAWWRATENGHKGLLDG
jgi:hypothetical protein